MLKFSSSRSASQIMDVRSCPARTFKVADEIRLDGVGQRFLTGVQSNPKGSTKLFQGFGGRFPIF